ncbi:WD40 repeat domain-containing serine/threonine-protein kinase [Dictyobacter kobayashii]|uniref:Protein kinase domain-containing protein n=1 Tax=Dictyobacter kobayashii TaxID=2014872 RepID=A0A402APY4_9CHLR|nr:WD40 repeat domain-containing serine/threonine-protein kinase [Dictyobacter kobayashii]GCE21223.1 hypothetical protein KDK_50230 [Dictyobacter kobayashii]
MASVKLRCGACGADNQTDATFCYQCGQALSPTATTNSPQTQLLLDDSLLNDRYHILDRAGTGGFGAVYKAADTRFGGRLVAIKEMGQKGLSNQELAEAVEGFKHEALLLAGLHHPHLPRIYDHFSDGGRWYLVMDYIEGETLEAYLEQAPIDPDTGHKKLSVEETLAIGRQLCTVLDYLHTRRPPIIFRDLKPANVMRTSDGHLYLIDFGIARHFKPGQVKDTMPLGSPGYAAPEQYGKGQTTPGDIYSLGVMLHQLLSGQDPTLTPFRMAPLHLTGQPALSRLETLIQQMVDMDEQRRPATAAVVREELGQIAANLTNNRVLYAHPERRNQDIYHAPTDEHEEKRAQAGSRQSMAEPEQRERQRPRGPSRRTFIIGGIASLVGLAGAAAFTGLYRSNDTTPDKHIIIRETPTATDIKTLLYQDHKDAVYSAAWSPDGRSIVSASADQTVRIWDASTGQTHFTYQKQGSQSYQALWSPDGKYIISGGPISVQQWLASNGQHGFTYNVAPAQPSHDIALSPDGTYLAVAPYTDTGKSSVQVWNTRNGNLVNTYNTIYVYCLNWSPDSKSLAIGSADTNIRILNITTGDTSLILTNKDMGMPRDVAWSPNGRRLAATGTDGKVHSWDTNSGEQLPTLNDPSTNGHMHSLAWSPNGAYIATGSTNGSVYLWQTDTGKLLASHGGQKGMITKLAWSPDDKAIVSSSLDHTVQIWTIPML